MAETADAVVIGAGVIGTAIALELNRSGLRTISVDKNPAAGYGPTSGSCAVIRVHYSTYDVSDDWIPIYDKSALPGFYMAIGSSGNQYKNAPTAGEMTAALIAFGREVDVGFYSRKRAVNPESSFSVLG